MGEEDASGEEATGEDEAAADDERVDADDGVGATELDAGGFNHLAPEAAML